VSERVSNERAQRMADLAADLLDARREREPVREPWWRRAWLLAALLVVGAGVAVWQVAGWLAERVSAP
jgi:hypothetical protein